MKDYVFRWKPEVMFALATFIIYVGAAFVATEGAIIDSWGDWFIGVAVAGARVTVAGIIAPLAAWVASRGAGGGV